MSQFPPKTKRKPGILFRLRTRVPKDRPQWLHGLVAEIDQQFHKLWMAMSNSLPGKHGATHLGGTDNIVSRDMPTEILLNQPGSPGDPAGGAAAGNHTHSTENLFGEGELPPIVVEAPSPFKDLKKHLDWLDSVAARDYALNVFKATNFK